MRAAQHATRAEYTLPPTPTAAGRARQLTQSFLSRPRPRRTVITAEHLGDAGLVVSELVTNAVEHGHGDCRLRLTVSGTRVTIEVHDDNPSGPRIQPVSRQAENGRGMTIVHALAQRLDILHTHRTPGKTVRAVLTG
ncbi:MULTISPECIES: ATP-binding protein [unclassified Streptomyces]|uniref:ATP-binding protein n=1 Tax=unclassified Streptomyces TaxID=2593676 RepID=UPI003BB5BE6A